MPALGNYCKAYPAARFREFENWTEKPVQTAPSPDSSATDSEAGVEGQYYFLQENFVVTDGIFLDENVVFDAVTPAWEQFCRTQLEFQIPPEALPEAHMAAA